MQKPASYHKFPAKPRDNAFIDRGEREGPLKRQRTYWRKKMLEAILEAERKRPRKPFDWRKAGEMLSGAVVGGLYGRAMGGTIGTARGTGKALERSREAADAHFEFDRRLDPTHHAHPSNDAARMKNINLLDPKAHISAATLKRNRLPKGVTWASEMSTAKRWTQDNKNVDNAHDRSILQGHPMLWQTLPNKHDQGNPGGAHARPPATKEGKPIVVAPKNAPREVVQHEFGHAQDFKEKGTTAATLMNQAMYGRPAPKGKWDTDPGYQRELSAWKNTDVPQGQAIQRHALKTYEINIKAKKDMIDTIRADTTRGTVAGAIGGAAIAGASVNWRRNKNLKAARGRVNLLHPKSQIVREDIIACILEQATPGPVMPKRAESTANMVSSKQHRTTAMGNDSPRVPLPPGNRIPLMRKPKTSNSVRENVIEALIDYVQTLYEYGVEVGGNTKTQAPGVDFSKVTGTVQDSDPNRPKPRVDPRGPVDNTPDPQFKKDFAARQAAKSPVAQRQAFDAKHGGGGQQPSSGSSRGGSAFNIQRGTPGTAARPGGGGYSSMRRGGGGGGSNPMNHRGAANPNNYTGGSNPNNSTGGSNPMNSRRGGSPNRMSGSGGRSMSGGGSSGWSGSVGGSNSSGSISGGASAFSRSRN